MDYAPRKEYDSQGERVYSEVSTGEWWWTTQEELPPGATIAPLIIGSDKTTMTHLSGDRATHPVYMTLGNIHGKIRYKKGLIALISYLPIPHG
jgi:hypothetical protein